MKTRKLVCIFSAILLTVPLMFHTQKSFAQGASCAAAVSVTVGGSCVSGTISDATVADAPAPSCGTASRDGWYSFTATQSGVEITAASSNRQLVLQVFSGSCASLTQLACANANLVAGAQTETVTLSGLSIGSTYFIRIVNETTNNLTLTSLCVSGCNPANASLASPASGSGSHDCCGVNLSWNAPAGSGCNAAASYDVYFGTAASPPFAGNSTATTYFTGALSPSTTYYWKIVSRNASGTATGTSVWSFTTGATVCTTCLHSIVLTDSYGDGWNGGQVTVYVNGTPVLSNIELLNGYGPQIHAFSAATGDIINVTRTTDGSYPSEMEVSVLSGGGTTLLATTMPLPAPGTSVAGCCPSAAPSCASSPVPIDGATLVNPCSIDLSWTAPAAAGCSGAASYDVYLGTSASPPFLGNTANTTYTLPFALADNTTYYWKIVPRNASGLATGCTIWSFTTASSPNPAYCMYDDAQNYPAGGTNCAQMTPESASQSGCIWNRSKISFASAFDYTINMYFGNNVSGGDGCAFVFQNSPAGISACGNDGSQLGAGGISNSVIIEFDTYDNDSPWHTWDIAQDHVAIEIDGDPDGPDVPFAGPVVADAIDGVLDDGGLYALRVTWDPATELLSVYVNGNLRLTANYDFINNVFGGDPNVWWGFTGSTGGLTNQQYFCPITIPVPVKLLDFTAQCQSKQVEFTWFTATEENNLYFTIEQSIDGVEFKPIATILGAGNSNSPLMYRYVSEMQVNKTTYYRLLQTDANGKTTMLKITSLQCEESEAKLKIINIYSDRNDSHTMTFSTPDDEVHYVEVFDMAGKRLAYSALYCTAGMHQSDICLGSYHGTIIVKLSNSKHYAIMKTTF